MQAILDDLPVLLTVAVHGITVGQPAHALVAAGVVGLSEEVCTLSDDVPGADGGGGGGPKPMRPSMPIMPPSVASYYIQIVK